MAQNWKNKYEKVDTTFTEKSAYIIRTVRTRLATDFMMFFRKMTSVYSPKGEVGKELQGGLILTSRIIRGLDTLLGLGGRPSTADEIDKLFRDIESLKLQMMWFKSKYNQSPKFKRESQTIARMTGVGFDTLIQALEAIEDELQDLEMQGESKAEFLKKHAPELYEMGAGAARFLGMATLGPFYEIGAIATRGITGIAREFRRRQTARQRQAISGRLGSIGADFGEEVMGGIGRGRTAGAGRRGVKDIFGMAGLGGARADRPEEVTAIGMAGFFDRDAYRAKWTKEVITLLKQISGKGPDAGIGGLQGVMSKVLPYVLGFLPQILAVTAATAAIMGLGAVWDKTLKDKEDRAAKGDLGAKAQLGVDAATVTVARMITPAASVLRMPGSKTTKIPSGFMMVPGLDMGAGMGEKVAGALKGLFEKAFPQTGTMPTTGSTQATYRPDDPLTDQLNSTDEDMA